MTLIPQDGNTDNSGLEPGASNRAHQALTAIVRVIARGAAREFLSRSAEPTPLKPETGNEENTNA